MEKSFYDFEATDIRGNLIKMSSYRNTVVLIVNTACNCAYTPQLKELETMHRKFSAKGFVVLGFPCDQFSDHEPESEIEIESLCSTLYGVTFQMFSKVYVNGSESHPLYIWLKNAHPGILGASIKWNFTKFLLDRRGQVVRRIAPATHPLKLEQDIKKYLAG